MKLIPLLRCKNLPAAVHFYTIVLDFTLKYPDNPPNEWVTALTHGDAELLLASKDGIPRIALYIHVYDVDAVFAKYVSRGLIVPDRPESPVHRHPIDQTWGLREFYIDDPDGNTLRFATAIR